MSSATAGWRRCASLHHGDGSKRAHSDHRPSQLPATFACRKTRHYSARRALGFNVEQARAARRRRPRPHSDPAQSIAKRRTCIYQPQNSRRVKSARVSRSPPAKRRISLSMPRARRRPYARRHGYRAAPRPRANAGRASHDRGAPSGPEPRASLHGHRRSAKGESRLPMRRDCSRRKSRRIGGRGQWRGQRRNQRKNRPISASCRMMNPELPLPWHDHLFPFCSFSAHRSCESSGGLSGSRSSG